MKTFPISRLNLAILSERHSSVDMDMMLAWLNACFMRWKASMWDVAGGLCLFLTAPRHSPIPIATGLGAYFYARRSHREGFAKVGAPTEGHGRSLQTKSNQHISNDTSPPIIFFCSSFVVTAPLLSWDVILTSE